MTDDLIIQEVHRAKDELARAHGFDVHSLFEALREADAMADRTAASAPPERIPLQPDGTSGSPPPVPQT